MSTITNIEWADATERKRAGRLLDGIEHNEFPQVKP